MSNVNWDTSELAERYDRVSDNQFEKGSLLVKMLGIKEGDIVLDVGCGTGRLTLHVSRIVGPEGKITGIDPSPPRFRLANDKLKGLAQQNVKFMMGNAEDLGSFADHTFDHIYYSSVFHWVQDKKTALMEAHRVLKPGGKIGMTTGDRDNPFTIRAISNKLLSRHPYAGHVKLEDDASKPVTRAELGELLEGAGFEDIVIELKEKKRYHPSPREAYEFSEASSFGNSLKHVPEGLRDQAVRDIEAELEKRRTPAGIELASSSLFAIAVKR